MLVLGQQPPVPRGLSHAADEETASPAPAAPLPPGMMHARVNPFPLPPEMIGVDLSRQTEADAAAKSRGCVACHQNVGDMHNKATVRLGCIDCHGGNPTRDDDGRGPRPSAAFPTPGQRRPIRSARTRC